MQILINGLKVSVTNLTVLMAIISNEFLPANIIFENVFDNNKNMHTFASGENTTKLLWTIKAPVNTSIYLYNSIIYFTN